MGDRDPRHRFPKIAALKAGKLKMISHQRSMMEHRDQGDATGCENYFNVWLPGRPSPNLAFATGNVGPAEAKTASSQI